ncbi:MAG: 3-hydroxyacyl-CoA dehydrogenase NAD-binding domain-containing protein [Dermatophilaceae bacterium]
MRHGHGFASACVIGAGLMGRRLAGVLAAGGLAVRLTDAQPDVLGEAAVAAEELAAARASERGTAAGSVQTAAVLDEAVAGADLVVEAVVEDVEVKAALFGQVSRLVPAAVLATNTSVLPVTAIAREAADPALVVGTHWWNPPDLIPVVEVVLGRHTDPAVAQRVSALLRELGKLPVLVHKDVPGFIGNRLQHALWREAFALVSEGVADAETVDLVVRNTIGLRLGQMGPIENADYVGLDLTVAIHDAVLPGLDRSTEPNPLVRELVAKGDLGAKTGQGLLSWPPGRREQTARQLAAHVAAELAARH